MSAHSFKLLSVETGQQRARPLPPDDRRQAILSAVIPLLVAKGTAVTTSEMSEAAQVAEGTIYRAFPDKATLIRDAVEMVMDPSSVIAELDQIPEGGSLAEQVETTVEILSLRLETVARLIGSLPQYETGPASEVARVMKASVRSVQAALTRILDRYRSQLAVEPSRGALALWGLVFSNSHPALASRFTTPELVEILLNGIGSRARSEC